MEVDVPDVRIGRLGDVGLLDRLGRAGVALCDRVRHATSRGRRVGVHPVDAVSRCTRAAGLEYSMFRAVDVMGNEVGKVGLLRRLGSAGVARGDRVQ